MNRSNKFTTGLNMDQNILYYLQYFNIIYNLIPYIYSVNNDKQPKFIIMNNENFEQILTFVRENVTTETWKSIDIAMTLEPYSSSLFELILIDKAIARTTILHDFRGLQSNDVDFLPRLELN